jgi:dTDP-4-dehydrorhamnose 3,5-epimerase-like enzyme
MSDPKFRIIETEVIKDPRGNLTVGNFSSEIPFEPKRYFLIYQVPLTDIRGEHAHKECHQLLLCLRGSVIAVCDDGSNRLEFELKQPNHALYMPPLTWGTQYNYSPDALLLVFASHYYDASDYLRSYDEFTDFIKR